MLLVDAQASHTRLWLLGAFAARNVLNADTHNAWNAGRHAPVSLTLYLAPSALPLNDTAATSVDHLWLLPNMEPPKGVVDLVIRSPEGGVLGAHSSEWEDRVWVKVEWTYTCPSSVLTLEFVSSPSWIALYAVSLSDPPPSSI